jgi:hypothetical protein
MTGPYIASLVSKRPARGDGLCRVDKTVSPRRRARASPSSMFADFESCGAGATRRPHPPRLSRELLVRATGCRNWHQAGSARSCGAKCSTRSP